MDNFEKILKAKGLTKTAFAQLIGIKKQNLNSLLKNPTLETIKKFAAALDVPVVSLFACPEQEHKCLDNTITCPHCGRKISLMISY